MKPMKLLLSMALSIAIIAVPVAAANSKAPTDRGPNSARSGSKATNADSKRPAHSREGQRAGTAKKYGVLCRGESKKHVKGEKGTEFSRCVVAAAKLKRSNAQT